MNYYWVVPFIIFPITGIFLMIYGYAMMNYVPYVEEGVGFIGIPFIIIGIIFLIVDVWIIIKPSIR